MANDPLSPEEIDSAIERLSHQLELLRSGPTLGGPSQDDEVSRELEAELAELKRLRSVGG